MPRSASSFVPSTAGYQLTHSLDFQPSHLAHVRRIKQVKILSLKSKQVSGSAGRVPKQQPSAPAPLPKKKDALHVMS